MSLKRTFASYHCSFKLKKLSYFFQCIVRVLEKLLVGRRQCGFVNFSKNKFQPKYALSNFNHLSTVVNTTIALLIRLE